MTLTFLDFFSGVGGFRHGLELAGMKCIGFCEKDKFARKSYEAMYDTKGEWFHDDITTIDPTRLPKADLWCAGSPCQNVSIAGKRAGLYGERSGLFFTFVELIKSQKEEDKPEWVLLEKITEYHKIENASILSDILEEKVDDKYYLSAEKAVAILSNL